MNKKLFHQHLTALQYLTMADMKVGKLDQMKRLLRQMMADMLLRQMNVRTILQRWTKTTVTII
jgi:hypothetical protein